MRNITGLPGECTVNLNKLTNGSIPFKASACSAEDLGSILGSESSPGEGNGNPLQYSCLKNPMDRGAWWATVNGVTKSWARLKRLSTRTIYWQD